MNEKNYPTLLKLQGNGAGETPSTGQELVTAFNENAENLLNAIKDVAKDIPSVSQQTGSGQNTVMSQEATTEALNEKFDKANVLQELGNETTMVMSQKAVRDAINAARTEYNISALVPNDEGYTLVTALPVLETILSDLGISKLFAGLKLSFVGADNVNYIYIYDNGSWYQQEIFKSTIFAEPISLTTGNKRIRSEERRVGKEC